MLCKRNLLMCSLGLVLAFGWTVLESANEAQAQKAKKAQKKNQEVWTDPGDPTLPPDFQVQGEYVGAVEGGSKLGCQVIALGKGHFQAAILPGGLPGAGWDAKHKILMDGKQDEEKTVFQPTTGKRRYLAQSPLEFSATPRFPPPGHKEYSASIIGGTMTGKTDAGTGFQLKKVLRKSPTLGKKAPAEALVLFDGSGTDEWKGGRLDKANGILNTDGHDIRTRRKFQNYVMHLEFLLPYRPDARGQGRGNSGFYQVDQYEVQVLDSFGLEGLDNECAGVYTRAKPSVNMCLPPLAWQTYDLDFTNAVQDETGKKVKNARLTLSHNGVVVHDNLEIAGVTGGARPEPEGTPGSLQLQGHGNPLQYRNIWIVEKK